MQPIGFRTVASAWWYRGSTRAVAILLTALAAVDSVYTYMWIVQRGIVGEANPFIRLLFEAGLGPLWWAANILATFIGAALLGSCVVALQDSSRTYPVMGLSLLAALKAVLGLYHLILFYNTLEFTWILWITAAFSFLATREVLTKETIVDFGQLSRSFYGLRSEVSTFIIASRAPKARPAVTKGSQPVQALESRSGHFASALRDPRLLLWVVVIVLAPVVALSLVQIILQFSGVLDLPRWMRTLGLVSQEQGQLFLVAMITIFLTVAVLIYAIVAVFEILSSGTTSKRRGGLQGESKRALRVFGVAVLLLAIASAGVPNALAIGTHGPAAAYGLASSDLEPEAVAAVDSKGVVHAAWIERVISHSESEDTLWYSTYDSETMMAGKAHVLDRSALLYSLDMTIDQLDNVHVVWVSGSVQGDSQANATEGWREEGQVMRVCYHVVLVNGTSSSSPKTLFQVVADSVWVSIAVGPDDELYLAWTETSRVGSTHIGSKALYAKLDAKDGLAESAITLLAHTNDTLRVMEAASSRDRMSLHLAWIEQFLETSSRIVYSRIDVSQNSSVMMSVGEVNGTISRFTMTSTLDGEVAIAWAYNEPSRGGSSARIVRVSRSGDMSAAELQIQRREMTELRYLTFDPKGNLCLLWTDLVEDVGHGRRPLRVRQPSLYLEKFNEAGQLSEETTTVAYVPVVATFVLEDGQLYVISEGEVVETATPSILGKSTVFFVALALLACTVSGVSTEAGTYVVASRLGAFQWESRCLRGRSASICRRLLRKIRERPGIMLSELKAISSDSISDIAFHLRMLENLQVIHSLSEGTKRRFYYVGEDDSDQPRSAELRKLIIRLLNEKPGLSEAQIARSLAISQQLANYHLRTLAKARLLSRTRDPSKVSYFVNARLLSRTDDVA